MFRLEIDTGNAAFHNSNQPEFDREAMVYEVRRILDEQIIPDLDCDKTHGKCIDYNGNTVGEWRFTRGSSKKY